MVYLSKIYILYKSTDINEIANIFIQRHDTTAITLTQLMNNRFWGKNSNEITLIEFVLKYTFRTLWSTNKISPHTD